MQIAQFEHRSANASRPMTGGRAIAEMLKLHEVGPLFGMGGFQLLPFYEACRVLGLHHALINDERSGAFAADAFAADAYAREHVAGAIREGLENTSTPTVLDVVVTRDPARMLPGVDNRTLTVQKGDRPV